VILAFFGKFLPSVSLQFIIKKIKREGRIGRNMRQAKLILQITNFTPIK